MTELQRAERKLERVLMYALMGRRISSRMNYTAEQTSKILWRKARILQAKINRLKQEQTDVE